MDRIATPLSRYVAIGLVTMAAAVVTGLAFAGWLHHGADIFLSHTMSGLAWCL